MKKKDSPLVFNHWDQWYKNINLKSKTNARDNLTVSKPVQFHFS